MTRWKAPDFKAFWDAYGLKRDRMTAERVWQRLTAKERRAAVAGIPAYRESCRLQGIAMMYGQGYLSHRRWEDDAAELDVVARRSERTDGTLFDSPADGLPALEAFEDMEIW